MAEKIRIQADSLKVDTFLSSVHTFDIINKYLDLNMSEQPVSRAGFNILHTLILNGGSLIPSAISKQILRSKYSVTRVIDTLERQGLVERLPIGQDRRNRAIHITPEGLRVVEKATIEFRERICQKLFSEFTEEELTDLNEKLVRLGTHVLKLIDETGKD